MRIEENVSLAPFTTFKVGGLARYFARLQKAEEAKELADFASEKNLPIFVLGGGSNIIVADEISPMLVIKNEVLGRDVLKEEDGEVLVKAGAGENWDEFVDFCVQNGFAGIEALSAIPGTVGGAPIQNIGAYGSEAAETIESVEVFDIKEGTFKTLSNKDCDFSYRNSLFKEEVGRYIVLSVNFRLRKSPEAKVPDYPGVAELLVKSSATLSEIRRAIIKIRASKLPEPKEVPNVGSFFKNPIVSIEVFEKIKKDFPEVKSFPAGEGRIKIPAGWLIENVGLKGVSFGKVGTHEKNALVLINSGGADFADIKNAQEQIKKAVLEKFGIELEREPIIVK